MKKLNRLIYFLALSPFLAACDDIGYGDRYIEEEAVEITRNVLLEEFTGQTCTNCPDAHRVIKALEDQYGDNLIVVSIHAGFFGIEAPGGLMQKEGDVYADRWGIVAYPAGVVDRTGSAMGYGDFATAVRDEMGKTTTLEMALEAQFSDDKKSVEVFTTLVSPLPLTGSLQLWLVEDDIVAPQIDNGNIIMDYVHNNVFRGCVNGIWGEAIPLPQNEVKYTSNVMELNEDWVPENLRVVGFYYNDGGVIQVERCEIK